MNKTLVKGLALLETLARNSSPLGVSELARQLDLGKSNTHRLLQTLTELGYVHRFPDTGTYQATMRMWELGHAVFAGVDLTAIADPAMRELLAEYGETVHFSVLDNQEVIYLAKLDSPNPVRAYTQVGGRAPAHCVATGKALLAELADEVLLRLSASLEAHSCYSITDPGQFMDEMYRVREQGFAVNAGEWRENVSGIAAAVRDPHGKAVAAIGISAPSSRIPATQRLPIGAAVIQAAQLVSTALATWPSNNRCE